jgi:organic radical activating enzyme
MTGSVPVPAAALAGVPAGVQSQGVWSGRRQLFVRFAGEAETATMYTSTALVREMERQLGRSKFHSIAIGGRDPLANVPFLLAALGAAKPAIPVMLDTDGQRPGALSELAPFLALVQVTVDFTGPDASVTHAMGTLGIAAQAKCRHALVLCPKDDTTDAQILRIVEQTHSAATEVEIVIHPHSPAGDTPSLDRRWSTLLEQSMVMHPNCRLMLRVPPPTGLR